MRDNLMTPYCKLCGDFRYLLDSRGFPFVCPRCSCPCCQRLIDEHPDRGGCVCFEKTTEVKSTPIIIRRSSTVIIPHKEG